MTMDEAEKSKRLAFIKTAGDTLKDCVDTGMYLAGKIHPALAALLGVAYAVKNVSGAAAGDERAEAVLKHLGLLRNQMNLMVDRMSHNFTALQAFFTENHFLNDVPLQTFVLFQYMNDVIADPRNAHHMKEFAFQYKKSDPVELSQRLLYQLEREFMNPLIQAIQAEPLHSKKIVVNWHNLIDSILTMLETIEINAAAWIHDEKEADGKKPEELRRVAMVQAKMDKFRKEYEKWEAEYAQQHPYWPAEVRVFVHDTLEKNPKKTEKELADMIARQLEEILTKSEFYVLVFSDKLKYVPYNRSKKIDRLVEIKQSGFVAIVYRSLYAHEKSNIAYACTAVRRLYRGDDGKNTITLHKGGTWDWITVQEMELWYSSLPGYNPVKALVAVKTDGKIDGLAWTKSKMHNDGPGVYTYGTGRRHKKTNGTHFDDYNFFILGGYDYDPKN